MGLEQGLGEGWDDRDQDGNRDRDEDRDGTKAGAQLCIALPAHTASDQGLGLSSAPG